jgi:hypothetical protein
MTHNETASREYALILMAFAILTDAASARSYLNCLAKRVNIVDTPKGSSSATIEESFGWWIDEAARTATFADGKALVVRRFDDRWISASRGDISYELDRESGNLTYAGSTMKDGTATTTIGAGRCNIAAAPAR